MSDYLVSLLPLLVAFVIGLCLPAAVIRWMLRVQGVAVTYRQAFVANLVAELVLLALFAILQLLLTGGKT